jgi:putative flippase GtrA
LIGLFVNFLLNKKYTFNKGPRKSYQEFRSFFTVAIFGLLLTNLFSYILVYIIGKYYPMIQSELLENMSHIFAVFIVSIYSFLAHKFFTFKLGLRQGLSSMFKYRS